MAVVGPCETSIYFKTTRCHVPESYLSHSAVETYLYEECLVTSISVALKHLHDAKKKTSGYQPCQFGGKVHSVSPSTPRGDYQFHSSWKLRVLASLPTHQIKWEMVERVKCFWHNAPCTGTDFCDTCRLTRMWQTFSSCTSKAMEPLTRNGQQSPPPPPLLFPPTSSNVDQNKEKMWCR